MKLSRRKFLSATAGTGVLVVGGTVWRAVDAGVFESQEGLPFEPWSNWRTGPSGDPIDLVRAAILAANPHNTQPWLFHVEGSRIDLFSDGTRNIGTIDPLNREMQIGLGCALENLLVAARAIGFGYELGILPNVKNSSHIARIELVPEMAQTSSLYDVIPTRHTNRGPYDLRRDVSSEILESLTGLGDSSSEVHLRWLSSESDKREIGALIVRATEAIVADRDQSVDSSKWLRFTSSAIQEHRDGLTLDAMGFPWHIRAAAKFFPQLSREKNDQSWLTSTREIHVGTASAFGIIQAQNASDPRQRIMGGRLYQRIHLSATDRKLGMHPLSQITERTDRETSLGSKSEFADSLKNLLNEKDRETLMIFRIGYPLREALSSPRRGVEDVMLG